MIERHASCVVGLVGLCALSGWAQVPAQQPVFRAGIDLVELDVSVFDKDRHPVRGLAATDFTVLEDGQPRKIEVFAPVDLPDPPPVTASWMKASPVDVDANDVTTGRLFVIVLDDQNLGGLELPATSVAHRVVESLGPSDLAALVFTDQNWKGQGFTADRARLMAAIDSMVPAQNSGTPTNRASTKATPLGRLPPSSLQSCEFLEVLREAIDGLKTIPHRRKFVVLISDARSCAPGMLMGGYDGFLITRAQTADVNVYAISPKMLNAVSPAGAFLNGLAAPTGGRAIIDTNDPVSHVEEIFDENRSYYLVGFVSENLKNRDSLKKIEVKVNRPGLTVRSRSLYDAPGPAKAETKKPPPPPAIAAIADLVPKADLPLRVSAAAIAKTGKDALVTVVLGVREPDQAPPQTDRIDMTVRAFTEDGREKAADRQITSVGARRADATTIADAEVLAHLTLPAGRYNLRIAAHSQTTGKEGSVYTDVVVPDFGGAALSLSGLEISASGGPSISPRDLLGTVLPMLPTAERRFSPHQALTVFARAFEGGSSPLQPATMRTHVVDDHDVEVLDRSELLPAAAFGASRSADYRIRLATSSWHSGAYLVSLSATMGAHVEEREVRIDLQ